MLKNEKCQTLPPWLWVWFVYSIHLVPFLIQTFEENVGSFFFSTDPTYASLTLFDRFKLINVPFWIPNIFLLLGVLTVLFPGLRKYLVEKKYELTENYSQIQVMTEIEDFLKLHAPSLKIKANLLSSSEYVFIYPIGYHKTGIAIFGKFIKLWRSDREKSQAVLLHEIGHYRNGDPLILGTGSFFESMVNHSISILIFFLLIEVALVLIDSPSHRLLGAVMFLFNSLPDIIVILTQTLAFITLPIVGIWSAELNADRFVLNTKINSNEKFLEVIEEFKIKKSLKQRILSQVTHPPYLFRKWMAVHLNEEKSILLYLFLFPVAQMFALFMLVIYAFASYIILFLFEASNMQEFTDLLFKNLTSSIVAKAYIWPLFSFMFILWPILAPYWVRFFSGITEVYNFKNYRAFILSALFLLFISVFLYFVQKLNT